MAKLPTVGGDEGTWGSILNEYLSEEHNSDGSHKSFSVSDSGGQVFNVKAYGAVGNGSTDDTDAIQAAMAAATSGGIIYFPPGTYIISETLNITANNIAFIGAGAGATTIKTASGSEEIGMLTIGNGTDTIAHITVAKILFKSVSQQTANQAIKLQKAFKTWLYNLRIENQYNALYVFNSTETFFRDSDIRDTANDAVIWESDLNSGYDLYINNVVADNPDVDNSGNGISWLGGENFVIQNCDFLHFDIGMHVHPSSSHQCRFGFFINAEFDFASNNNMTITNTNGGDIIGLTFTNTWTGTATNYGVLIDDNSGGELQGIRFIGHKSFHNGLAGFRLAGGQDIHLLGCDVIGNSQTSSNTRSGIEITSGIGSNISIIGCKSGNGYQQGNTQSYGINIDGSHTYSKINISNCDLSENTNGSINLNSAEISSGKIFNNVGYLVNRIYEAGTPEIWLSSTSHTSKILDDGNLHIEGEDQNVWINGASDANVLLATGGGNVGIGTSNPGSKLSISGLPTSADGLSSGDVWNNGGILNIVP